MAAIGLFYFSKSGFTGRKMFTMVFWFLFCLPHSNGIIQKQSPFKQALLFVMICYFAYL